MSDPFASLDPIQKPKTAAERVLTAPAYNHLPPPGAPVAASPFGGGGGMGMNMGMGMGGMAPSGMGMSMNMGGMAPTMGMGMGGNNGMMNMAPPGMGMGGMAPPGTGSMGMNPGMGGMGMNSGMGGMSMGQQQHQQNPFQQHQQPVMYDNIKNLLQQKPKAPAAFEDAASMDFLENLGGGGGITSSSAKTNSGSFPASNPQVRAAEPTSAVADPFGGGGFGSASPVSPSMGSGGDIGLSIFETGGSASAPATASPSTSGSSKSSALADRLANGRRKTQEMQRSQLQLNANSFGSAGAVSKISLKEMAGQTSSKNEKTFGGMSLDDFSSGGSSSATTSKASSDFGASDPFGGRGSSFGSGSAAAAPRQASFGAHQEDSGSKPVDENDNTFW